MSEEDEKAEAKTGANFSLISVSSDALGLGKAAKELTPVGIEIIRGIGKMFGRLYQPVAIIAEGAARRHVRIKDVQAEAKLIAELGGQFDPRRAKIIEDVIVEKIEAVTVIEPPKKPRKPRKPKPVDLSIGLATSLDRPLGRLTVPNSRKSLKTRANRLGEALELRRQENIEATVRKAILLSYSSKETEAHAIDEDFVAEWIDAVKNISNEQLQEYWARILVEAPASEEGRVEKPVVDFLRALDPKMARLLRHMYLEGAITGWKMPVSRVDIDYITEEVGLATIKSETVVSILGGAVVVSAFNDGDSFELVHLSARARRIGEIVYGKVDIIAQSQAFFEDLPQWLSEVMFKNFVRTVHLTVYDKKSVHTFSISTKDGELLTVLPGFAPAHSQYVDPMDLGGAPYEAALKASLRKLAAAKKLKFEHAYHHAVYGVKDYKVPGT